MKKTCGNCQQDMIPSPGSPEAKKLGCTCAVMDNNHGKGFPWGGERCFYITEGCPLHDKLEDVKE